MYQMIIIDDEPIVREGIKHLIPWEQYQFHICEEGIDGIDGLEKVLLYQPDLVLVDIKMPGMSGLEVIKKAREAGFMGTFMILTGYSDFEFAKTAISLGVREYLLKPIDEDELIQIVMKIKQELDHKKETSYVHSLNEENARQELLRRLLLYTEQKEVLREEMKFYQDEFQYSTFCVAILANQTRREDGFIQYPSKEKLSLIIKGLEPIDSIRFEDSWALICKGKTYDDCLEKLIENNKKVETIYGEGYFISLGHDIAHWEDLHYSYECAKMLLGYHFLYHSEQGISIKVLEANRTSPLPELYDKICPQIEIGDIEGLNESLYRMEEYCKVKLLSESESKIYITHQMIKLKMVLEDRYDSKKNQFPDFDTLTTQIKDADSLAVMLEDIKQFCNEISQVIAASGADNIVKRVNAYLEKNYDSDIKLESIAKMFNYNSAYLGKVFKKEMGESFNNILDHIRIENAKKLLSNTDLKVYQVSERVGYSNIDYFYSKFKRYVGISPKEFKKGAFAPCIKT